MIQPLPVLLLPEVQPVGVEQEVGQVEELGHQLLHVGGAAQAVVPRAGQRVKQAVRLVKAPSLTGGGLRCMERQGQEGGAKGTGGADGMRHKSCAVHYNYLVEGQDDYPHLQSESSKLSAWPKLPICGVEKIKCTPVEWYTPVERYTLWNGTTSGLLALLSSDTVKQHTRGPSLLLLMLAGAFPVTDLPQRRPIPLLLPAGAGAAW